MVTSRVHGKLGMLDVTSLTHPPSKAPNVLSYFVSRNDIVAFMFQQLASVRNPNRTPLAHYDSSLCVAYGGGEVDSIYIPTEQIDGGRTQYMTTIFTVPIFVLLLYGADHHRRRLRPLPGSGHHTSASSPAAGSTAAVGGGLSSGGKREESRPNKDLVLEMLHWTTIIGSAKQT
ncbi:hypothetical protein GUJ93_ZPchr0412g33622 [Zizania palustris]|uniref:Uncharacterized protein n=1 Tax=Zizania palustris TaxID=103762 RepID=A0A8J5UUB3_ZIZPA|nr:hypothetical protein GUJ93_ZPchr0412g33622 [Zizania palustris]